MKKLTLVLGLTMLFSTGVFAQEAAVEGGWKGKLRPMMTKILGAETTNKLIGTPPVAEETMEMPPLPNVVSNTTDVSVYNKDSELRQQGKEFAALPKAKQQDYDVAFLKEIFQATRRAPARSEDLAKWINVLANGGSREGVYRGLVLDEVYASLESYEEANSQKLIDWTIAFSRKFLGLGFGPEAFKQANLFFLKRHISEKVLDMLDTLEAKPEDFRKWYAVFSMDIAKEFPGQWPGTIRANTSPNAHLEWAKKAPLQHIKGEVLIKLHTVMNKLQDSQ